MRIQKFEDILAWQKSQDLAVEIYELMDDLKDFGFKNQICRASVSISNNVAEGFDRKSDPDFARFLYYSLASCSEVRSMLYLAERLAYIKKEKAYDLREQTFEISKLIRGFIKSLELTRR